MISTAWNRRWVGPLLVLAALLPAPPALAASAETLAGVASVVDGDTIEIHGRRIRLHGIDAPEGRQTCTAPSGAAWPCGRRSAAALADRIGRQVVRCAVQGRDRWGRAIAVCRAGGESLNRWMVASGWAVAFRRYSADYVADEERARAAGRGLWAGSFEMPWAWRARGRR